MPNNHLWINIADFILEFILSSWISLLVLLCVWGFSKWLHSEFYNRSKKYTKDQPKEHYWLNLQCKRWERHVHQVIIAIYLTVAFKILAKIYIGMTKEILSAGSQTASPSPFPEIPMLPIIELSLFIIVLTIKIRGLLDAKGVHHDLKIADL